MFKVMRAKLLKFLQEERASSTVEFVIFAPFLLAWLFGFIVFFDAFRSRLLLTSANSTVADIISRNSEVTDGYMDLLQLLQTSLLSSNSNSGLRISSIQYTIDPDIPDDPGTYSVLWSAVRGSAELVLIDDDINLLGLPDMFSSETVLLIESTANYIPLTKFVGLTTRTLQSNAVVSPRYESRVVWVN